MSIGAIFASPDWVRLLAVALVALLGELALLALGRRRARLLIPHTQAAQPAEEARPSRFIFTVLPGLAALALPLCVVGTGFFSVHEARTQLLALRAGVQDFSERAQQVATLSAHELHTIPLALLLALPATLVACFALGFLVHARVATVQRAARVRAQGTAPKISEGPSALLVSGTLLALLASGIGPMVGAVCAAALVRLETLSQLAELPLNEQLARFAQGLGVAHAILARGLWTSLALLGATLGMLSLPLVRHVRGRMGNVSHGELALGLASLVLSALLCLSLEPMRRDNALPWPAPSDGSLVETFATPQLHGPDALEPAPLLALSPSELSLEGVALDAEQLSEELATLHGLFALLHPNEKFKGTIVLLCQPQTDGARLRQLLRALAQAEYVAPTFAFERRETSHRPVLGMVEYRRVTGARTTLAAHGMGASALEIDLSSVTDCQALCERVVAGRRSKREVLLKLASD